jgi:hypothetical protein
MKGPNAIGFSTNGKKLFFKKNRGKKNTKRETTKKDLDKNIIS